MRTGLFAASCTLWALSLHARAGQPTAQEPPDYWTGDIHAPVPGSIRGGHVIHAARLPALIHRNHVIIVDASNAAQRPEGLAPDAPWLPVAHKAIPGTHWIPGAGGGTVTPEFDVFLRGKLAQFSHGDFAAPIVVYCHERCWLSWNGAKRALSYGYRKVYWFPEGIEGWKAAKLPTTTVEEEKPQGR